MIKAALDTNVIISGILWKGASNQLLKLAEENKILLFINPTMLKEVEDVLLRPKFLPRVRTLNTSCEAIIQGILSIMHLCEDLKIEPAIKENSDDNNVLSCAIVFESKYLISGDRHLLNLSSYSDIVIFTPRQFLNLINTGKLK